MAQNRKTVSYSWLKVCWTLFYRFRFFFPLTNIAQCKSTWNWSPQMNKWTLRIKNMLKKKNIKRKKNYELRRGMNQQHTIEIRSLTALNDQWLKGWQKSPNWFSSCSVLCLVFCLFLKCKRAPFCMASISVQSIALRVSAVVVVVVVCCHVLHSL